MTAATFRRNDSHSAVRTFDDFGVYGDELGPFGTFCAQAVVFVGMLIAFPAVENVPGKLPYVLLLSAIGVMFLAPRNAVRKMPFSVSLTAFLGMVVLSVIWTNNIAGSIFDLQKLVPLIISFSIIVGLLKFEDLTKPLIWFMRFALLATAIAVATDPAAREHISEAQYGDENLPGWHGWYPHKNFMAPFFGFGAMTVLMFDRNQWTKWATASGLAVMIFMSDSRTGLFAFVLMLGVWWWLEHFSQLDDRNGVMFFVSTFGLGLLAIIGAFASISAVTSAAGKDSSFSGRTDIWAGTFEAFLERPILGYGLNGLFWSDPLQPETAELWRTIGFEASHAHQGILDMAVQFGIVGSAIFVAMFYSTFAAGWRMIKTNRKVGMWIVAVMAGQTFMSLSENVLTGSWMVMIVIFRLASIRRHGMEFPERGTKVRSNWLLR